MIITPAQVLPLVQSFAPAGDDLVVKSQELITGLLQYSENPFSRYQFTPGHVTSTALVLHPEQRSILLMYHHRLNRWLLPGGHVEPDDVSLSHAAAREAVEETHVELQGLEAGILAGMDVHGIPRKANEPFHLHHDFLWAFRAASADIQTTEEALRVCWAAEEDWSRLSLSPNICRAALRIFGA